MIHPWSGDSEIAVPWHWRKSTSGKIGFVEMLSHVSTKVTLKMHLTPGFIKVPEMSCHHS